MADAGERPESKARLEWAERWLSPSRLSSYLDLCGGDVDRALDLHEWSLMLGRALMGDIAHFELVLRNAYDRALTERFEGNERLCRKSWCKPSCRGAAVGSPSGRQFGMAGGWALRRNRGI